MDDGVGWGWGLDGWAWDVKQLGLNSNLEWQYKSHSYIKNFGKCTLWMFRHFQMHLFSFSLVSIEAANKYPSKANTDW